MSFAHRAVTLEIPTVFKLQVYMLFGHSTHNQLDTHWYVLSTLATDVLVQKHQAISIHSADKIFIVLDKFRTERLHLYGRALENMITFWKRIV